MQNIDFVLTPTPGMNDLRVLLASVSTPTSGFDFTLLLSWENVGTTQADVTLTLNFDPSLEFVSSNPAAVQNDAQLTWTINGLEPGQGGQALVTLHVPASVWFGNLVFAEANIDGGVTDLTPADNSAQWTQIVTGSFDPNDKQVSPTGDIAPAAVTQGQWLDYTVRFQNTGTAPAVHVQLRDTLSAQLYFALPSFQHGLRPN